MISHLYNAIFLLEHHFPIIFGGRGNLPEVFRVLLELLYKMREDRGEYPSVAQAIDLILNIRMNSVEQPQGGYFTDPNGEIRFGDYLGLPRDEQERRCQDIAYRKDHFMSSTPYHIVNLSLRLEHLLLLVLSELYYEDDDFRAFYNTYCGSSSVQGQAVFAATADINFADERRGGGGSAQVPSHPGRQQGLSSGGSSSHGESANLDSVTVLHYDAFKLCAICLDNIPEHRCFTLHCNHSFHLNCLKRWYNRLERPIGIPDTCPMCREPFTARDEVNLNLQ